MSTKPNRLNELKTEAIHIVTQELRENGVSENEAPLLAELSVLAIFREWGGQQLYIAKDTHLLINERYNRIYEDFTGSNHAELSKKYGLSLQRIYKIINNMREFKRKHNI